MKLSAEQIHEKVDAEVGFAKKRINVVGMSVEEVQHIVDGLERRLDELQAKVTYANKGILLLCSVVGSLPQQERKSTGYVGYLRATPLPSFTLLAIASNNRELLLWL